MVAKTWGVGRMAHVAWEGGVEAKERHGGQSPKVRDYFR